MAHTSQPLVWSHSIPYEASRVRLIGAYHEFVWRTQTRMVRYAAMATKTDAETATTQAIKGESDADDASAGSLSDRVFINVAIPVALHRRLRIRQITDDLVMRDVVTAALEAWLS